MNRIQPGQSIITVPGDFLRVVQARPSGAADWWDPNGAGLCIWAAYQPKGAASLAASYVDLSGNGNNCAPGVAPAWDAVNGWKFNGSTHYLTTIFSPALDQSQSVLVQISNGIAVINKFLWGSSTATNRFGVMPAYGANKWSFNSGVAGVNDNNAAQTSGNVGVAGNACYTDGADDGVALPGGGTGSVHTVTIGCRNHNGSPIFYWQGYIQAFAIYDCTLTAPQVAAVAAAMAAL